MTVTYAIEPELDPVEFSDVLERSGLAARRPVDEPERIRRMVENASLIVTARDEAGRLIGVARSVTDFAFCCYLSDLAVDRAHQHGGVGRELVERTCAAAGGDGTMVLLLAAPAAADYYPKVGFRKLDTAYARGRLPPT